MRKLVLYGENKEEKKEIVEYLSQMIEEKERGVFEYSNHLYPVSTSGIGFKDGKITEDVIGLFNDYENNVAKTISGSITDIVIEECLAERIFETVKKEGFVNGYSGVLDNLNYDEVLVLDDYGLENGKKDSLCYWFSVKGCEFTPVLGKSVKEKAEFIYNKRDKEYSGLKFGDLFTVK